MSKKLEFFWDAVSPYTYLASTQVEQLAAETGAELVWRPMFLAGVMQATGNKPPATVPHKGKHLFVDLLRWAALYDESFWFPKSFPINSVNVMRMACYAESEGKQVAFAQAVMRAHWADAEGKTGANIAEPDVLASIAADVGLDSEAAMLAVQDQAYKDQLRENTEEAVKRGAFGAPTFFVGNEMFWGNDRLQLVRQALLK